MAQETTIHFVIPGAPQPKGRPKFSRFNGFFRAYIKVAENFMFPVASYGLEEDEPQVSLKVESYVTSTQQRNNTYTRTMRIDCIILKPHEE